jgi:hypothetical protein
MVTQWVTTANLHDFAGLTGAVGFEIKRPEPTRTCSAQLWYDNAPVMLHKTPSNVGAHQRTLR